MNYIILFCVVLAMLNGIIQGLGDISNVRKHPSTGMKESNNIFTFLFTDKY